MGCGRSTALKYSDKAYFEPCEHDTLEEINVPLGVNKHVRHIATWKPIETAKAIVLVSTLCF